MKTQQHTSLEKQVVLGILVTILAMTIVVVGGCSLFTGSKPPTIAEIHQAEDKFCSTVASARKLEQTFSINPQPSSAAATASGGSPGPQ